MTRILAPWLLLAAFLLFPSLIVAGVAHAQDRSPEALAPFAARELAPGIHLLATPPDFLGPAISNVSIIEQSDGIVLIDSGATAADGRRIVAYVRSLTDKPVKAVVITHWHNDHPLGVSEIRAAWPDVRIISTGPTRAGLLGPASTSVGPRPDERFDTMILNQVSDSLSRIAALRSNPSNTDAQRERYDRMAREMRAFGADFRGTYLVPPTETFADTLLINDAERPVRLMFLGRANTEGDAIAWLPRQRIVMTGDVVVSPTPFGFFSFPEDWVGVLQRLKGLDFALLVPGHGEPQADAAYLDRLIATIGDIRAQVGPLARQGLSLEEVRERVDFSAQTAIFGTTPRLRLGFESYWLNPMVENAWKEARGEAIVQGDGVSTPASENRRRAR
jgi:glyoxylase-like metal-dependent hydrolase (beta-lactamase superfamily II)